MANVRIATVKATGKKYLVTHIDFRANKVCCWGEVTKSRGGKTWHEGTKAFLIDAVDVAEVPKTDALVEALFFQGIDAKRAAGYDIDVRRTNRGNIRATNYGKR